MSETVVNQMPESDGTAVRSRDYRAPECTLLHPTADLNISLKSLRACEGTTAELVRMFTCERCLHILIKEGELQEVCVDALLNRHPVTH